MRYIFGAHENVLKTHGVLRGSQVSQGSLAPPPKIGYKVW